MDNPWYSFYVGDYARKTAHLSLLEHGAYRLLLDYYYANKKPLPLDESKLFRICRARTPTERRAVSNVLSEFFSRGEHGFQNKRCSSEIDKLLNYSNRQSAAAKLRHSHGTATAQPRARVPQPQPDKETPKGVKKATRFQLVPMPETWIKYCQERRPDLDPEAVYEDFSGYWIGKAGKDGLKLHWDLTWQSWVRNQIAKPHTRAKDVKSYAWDKPSNKL